MNISKMTGVCCLALAFMVGKADARDRNDEWKLRASDINAEYVGAPVGNGGIGILPWNEPFSVRHVVLNHVFDAEGPQGVSRALHGINPFVLAMQVDGEAVGTVGISAWEQEIDMREAVHSTRFTAAGKAKVNYSVRALRHLPYAGLVTVEVEALADVKLQFTGDITVPDDYEPALVRQQQIRGKKGRLPVLRKSAVSKYRRRVVSASSTFLIDNGDESVDIASGDEKNILKATLKKGRKLTFSLIGAVCTDRDFLDPYNESDRQVIFAALEGTDRLTAAHRAAWDELWRGDILIEGDPDAQRAVRFALYNLYSYVREGSGLSISPMGLSDSGYNGHVFWDSELWMYPPMLCMNDGIARSMIDYRTDRLAAACRKARAYGYRGAMFPWESDDAGEESCPTWALTGPFEHHITADIAIGAWNYWCVTRNRSWLEDKGWLLIREVADFWLSRVTPNADGTYSVCNVVCADEYAEGVDDNAFTNGAVVRALEAAVKASAVLGLTPNPQWSAVAGGLRIPRFADSTTREHATYDGRLTKQADANLLGYPLGLVNDPEAQRRDMDYYACRIDTADGPAMSWSIFGVQYARLGDADRAWEMFCRSYKPNSRPPFGVIAETPTSDNPYFATGAGGMLQTVINGFCGLDITDEGIRQLPSTLPRHWKQLTITGVGPERRTYTRTQRP
jgi:trehalose/maltose hydrolase-like predicted phosphorylase